MSLPIPKSANAIGFSSELKSGTVWSRTLAEQELVVFRTQSGQACAMGACRPHLGAHMGISGKVADETIRCPFDDFRFDTTGVCLATSDGTQPLKRSC